jgi:hypothetical protein
VIGSLVVDLNLNELGYNFYFDSPDWLDSHDLYYFDMPVSNFDCLKSPDYWWQWSVAQRLEFLLHFYPLAARASSKSFEMQD